MFGDHFFWKGVFGPKKIEFNDKRVRVTSRLWLQKSEWEEPLSAFKGVRLDSYGDIEFTTDFCVRLVHPVKRKSLILYSSGSRVISCMEIFITHGDEDEDAKQKSAALAFMNKVSEILNIPVL